VNSPPRRDVCLQGQLWDDGAATALSEPELRPGEAALRRARELHNRGEFVTLMLWRRLVEETPVAFAAVAEFG